MSDDGGRPFIQVKEMGEGPLTRLQGRIFGCILGGIPEDPEWPWTGPPVIVHHASTRGPMDVTGLLLKYSRVSDIYSRGLQGGE